MSQWPTPTRADHDKFCRVEGWRHVRDARGRKGTHHITYELALPDGRTLRTRVSHPPNRIDYGPALWAHILRDQLQVSEPEFWACVSEGRQPNRGQTIETAEALPADLAHLLVTRVGLPETDVARMTRTDAVERLNRYWMTGE